MDYQRFIELLERFFERAGTLLHRKGADYSAIEGNPSFLILDENRGIYYLAEAALPPAVPEVNEELQTAIDKHAAATNMDPYILRLFTLLGESIKLTRTTPIDDPIVVSGKLNQKSALVAADKIVDAVNEVIEDMGLEVQKVPLKGIFTIYFFNESEKIETLYETVISANQPKMNTAEAVGTAQSGSEEPDEAKLDDLLNDVDELTAANPVLDEVDEPKTAQEPVVVEAEPEVIELESTEPESAEPESIMTKHDERHAPVDEKPEVIVVKDQPVSTNAVINTEVATRLDQPPLRQGTFRKLCTLTASLVSLLLFAPAFVVNRLTKCKVPDAISYWFGAICVALGMYYYPLSKVMNNTLSWVLQYASSKFNVFSSIIGSIDYSVYESASISTNMYAVMDTIAGLSVFILAFDSVIAGFINSVYYLQYMLAIGFVLAIIPAFRLFGRRMVCMILMFYVLYLPAIAGGSLVVGMLATNLSGLSAIANSFATPGSIFYTLSASVGGVFLISLLIPLLPAFLAAKLAKGISREL